MRQYKIIWAAAFNGFLRRKNVIQRQNQKRNVEMVCRWVAKKKQNEFKS